MQKQFLILAGALLLPALAAAAGKAGFESLSYTEARREADALSQSDSVAAVYIWTNKIVYSPGDPLTLRWTSKPNNDLYPYTLFAYRLNNQTGAKTYLPGNSADVTDIFGNTAAQGFRITRLPEASKQVLVGSGGILVSSPLTVPNEPGMHTLVFEMRDFTATRVIKSAYYKVSVVTEFVNVSGNIESSVTWVNTKAYRVSGIVFVRNNAVLTIEPGTVILGQPSAAPNPSTIVITRTGRIVANGTKSRPIIMTSSRDVGQRDRGDWGGLILLGRARINVGAEAVIEGLPDSPDARFGPGSAQPDENHSCGSLRYVRVEFAGAALAPASEVNGVTYGGCGKGTVSDHLQVHYGFDDAFEWFGGNNDGKYLVATYARDDYFDWQLGWSGRVQYGVAVANGDFGNRGIEADNLSNPQDAQPISNPTLYNVSFIGNPLSIEEDVNANAGIWLRRGTAGTLRNIVIYDWNQTGIEIRDTGTVNQINADNLRLDGLLLWNSGRDRQGGAVNTLEGQVGSPNTPAAVLEPLRRWVTGSPRVFVEDPKMRRPLEYSDPDFRPGSGSPLWKPGWVQPPDDGFFDQSARFLGAFGDENWTEEWTTFHIEPDLR